MLFGTCSQAHAYDPSDHIETRLQRSTAKVLQVDVIRKNFQVLKNDMCITEIGQAVLEL